MQRNSSFGTSWADQWDYGGDPSPRAPRDRDRAHGGKSGGGGGGGVGEKTKAAAATGIRKVKEGTAQGFQWIKDKCQRKNGGKKQHQGSELPGYY